MTTKMIWYFTEGDGIVKRKIIISLLLISAMLVFPVSIRAVGLNDKSVVFATQNALNKAGFNCGAADGVAGNNTISAITQYQADSGLEVTGQINKELLTSLGFSIGNPFGVAVSSFVARYNESAVYFNNISTESGDPSINQMTEETVFSEKATLDSISTVSFGLNNVESYVDSCILQDDDEIYDVRNLYELSSVAYALNSEYSSPGDALSEITTLFENYIIESGNLTYSVLNAGGKAAFSFTYKNPNS